MRLVLPGGLGRTLFLAPLTFLLVLPSIALGAVEITNVGPLTYIRDSGKPTVYTAGFPGVAGAGVLHVQNSGVSSAVIRLNGTEVLSPSAFNQQVQQLAVPVTMIQQNSIEIELRSKLGSSLSVRVTQTLEADAAAVIGPLGGTMSVQDPTSPAFGASLDVPSHALTTPTLLTLNHTPSAPHFSDGKPGVSPVRLDPSGLVFASAATLTLPYRTADLAGQESLGEDTLGLFTYDDVAQAWLNVPVETVDTIAQRVVSKQLRHFSYYALRDDQVTGTCRGCRPPKELLPVLLVHGFQIFSTEDRWICGHGSGDPDDGTFGTLRLQLESLGADVHSLQYNSGKRIADSAESFRRAVDKILGSYEVTPGAVTVIAHSEGGLVARYAIDRKYLLDPLHPRTPPVSTLVTLDTPHLGLEMGHLPDLLWIGGPYLDGIGAALKALYCPSLYDMDPGSEFLEGTAGLNTIARVYPTQLSSCGKSYRLFAASSHFVVEQPSALAQTWDHLGQVISPVFEQSGLAAKEPDIRGCGLDPLSDCGHSGIAHIQSEEHPMSSRLREVVQHELWFSEDQARACDPNEIDRQYVRDTLMPTSRIIERLRISDRPITINTGEMLARGYQNAVQQGQFTVYRRPAAAVTEIPYGRYDGYYERGDPFPTNLEIIFAWKADGTAYVGTDGPDDASLATVVDGLLRLPSQERFVGNFLEGNAFRLELKNLLALGLASGITAQQLDPSAYGSFLESAEVQIFHRYSKPIYRLASAIYLQGIAGPQGIYDVMRLWTPFASWGAGSASRSFTLTVSGAQTSYAVAVANNDNANSSAVTINGQTIVSNNHCCENYWRRTEQDVSTVLLSTSTVWSQGAPQFNFAVVADDLTFSEVNQSPPGGLSNNRPPLLSKLPPLTWTSQ